MQIPWHWLIENQNDRVWTIKRLQETLSAEGRTKPSIRSLERALAAQEGMPSTVSPNDLVDEIGCKPNLLIISNLTAQAKRKRAAILCVQALKVLKLPATLLLVSNDGRKTRQWFLETISEEEPNPKRMLEILRKFAPSRNSILFPHGDAVPLFRKVARSYDKTAFPTGTRKEMQISLTAYPESHQTLKNSKLGNSIQKLKPTKTYQSNPHNGSTKGHVNMSEPTEKLSHLDRLEADSIYIIREVMAYAEKPVMLYSIGKDSSVMLHLARKAFFPSTPPFPLLHVDTRWKFQEMYKFRERMANESKMELIVHINPDGIRRNINPFDHGSALHTDVMKTEGLKQALDQYKFDVAFGGARRDEEKSRAKERVFSFRTTDHLWDPKNQRPELWDLYNGKTKPGESVRVFPLSNWTELDIWQYIYRENIDIVPLYFAAERPIVDRDGLLIMVDDERMKLFPGEHIKPRMVRFRTLGCYPLTGAVDSTATDLSEIVLELLESRNSERQGRAIDSDSSGSMEKKKREGYF